MTQTQTTKVGGRLRGRKSVKSSSISLTEERASVTLTHQAGEGRTVLPGSKTVKAKRAALLEIDKTQIDFRPAEGAKKLLEQARRDTGYAAWRMVSAWMAWHELAGTADRLRSGLGAAAFPPGDLHEQMYRAACAAAPEIPPLCLRQTQRWLSKTLNEQTSPLSSLKRWQAVLLAAENWPQFRALPLRVYSQLCRVERRDGYLWLLPKVVKRDGRLVPLTLRVLRPDCTGANGNPKVGRKFRQWKKLYERLERIADGLDSMPGCLLTSRRGKWFFALTYEAEFDAIEPKQGATLFLRAGRKCAFVARYAGRHAKLGAEELLPLGKRRREFVASRSHATRDTKSWWNYCDTLSHRLANEIAEAAKRHKIETVVILAGHGLSALDRCGIEDEDLGKEATRFPMQHFQVLLARKLIPCGIQVVTRANFRSVKRRKERSRKMLEATVVRGGDG